MGGDAPTTILSRCIHFHTNKVEGPETSDIPTEEITGTPYTGWSKFQNGGQHKIPPPPPSLSSSLS